MKTTLEATTVVNKITGKTISEMSWDEIRKISKPISKNEVLQRLKVISK